MSKVPPISIDAYPEHGGHSQRQLIIRKKTPIELIHEIYKNEGWIFVEGESRVTKINSKYDISVDHRKGEYVAKRK